MNILFILSFEFFFILPEKLAYSCTLLFKYLGSICFINIFIQLGCIKLIKSDLLKISVSNNCFYFKLSIHNI